MESFYVDPISFLSFNTGQLPLYGFAVVAIYFGITPFLEQKKDA
jgi:hypothetical protein